MVKKGVQHALYTDVHRDGQLTGVNIAETIALAQATGLQVIASGGVSTLDEIEQLTQSQVVAGAIIGMALYEERLTLAAALNAAGGKNAG
jgi:phosphoribosylformimino-5-aminoimidazole carboxamide ribotide isomerase